MLLSTTTYQPSPPPALAATYLLGAIAASGREYGALRRRILPSVGSGCCQFAFEDDAAPGPMCLSKNDSNRV
ncbi:hypothetical protein GCM10007067_12200 [Lysobacter bugurensis]|uniref:Uncharacterized protein n=1 Tax=Cognatilysobacter bugurensis TaxID=543356 RepID=A0A918W781_9GAMM|nr:hypothetical protein GCM10007067_12200 [Lysobacter bugurensis]